MDLRRKMYITSTMTSPVTKRAKTSKWHRLESLCMSTFQGAKVLQFYSLFAIIQSTFYRLIKGQQYLRNMYEINCDD